MEGRVRRVHTSCCASGLFPSLRSHHSSLSPVLHSPPSGCVKRCGAVWVSSQTLEPNPQPDTHTHTHRRAPFCTAAVSEQTRLSGRRKRGGAKARKRAFEKLMSPDGSQQVAEDWDISHLAVCVCVCAVPSLDVLLLLLHNRLIMFLFTAD